MVVYLFNRAQVSAIPGSDDDANHSLIALLSYPFQVLLQGFAGLFLPDEVKDYVETPDQEELNLEQTDLQIDLWVNLGLSYLLRLNLDQPETLQPELVVEALDEAYEAFERAVALEQNRPGSDSVREVVDNTPVYESRAQCYLRLMDFISFALAEEVDWSNPSVQLQDPLIISTEFSYACSGIL